MKIKEILSNISESEKKVFINGEHYNEMGSVTRKKILELAQDIENGFFVEVGACMGTDTKFLEVCGWNGLLIEPSDGLYNWCKENRNCIVENYALVSDNYKNEFVAGISAFRLPDYIEGHNTPNSQIYAIDQNGNQREAFKAITFSKLAKNNDIKNVDIFVLDVEGLELEILEGINFEEVNISNFIIECNFHIYSLEKLDEIMISKGYKNMGIVERLSDIQSDYHYSKI